MTYSIPDIAPFDPSGASFYGFVRQKTLLQEYVPFSAATLWRLINAGKFPKPVKVTDQITVWRLNEIREWMKNPIDYRLKTIDGGAQ
jgi:hypothetical protein